MSKRFTDTEKWSDPWFMDLGGRHQLLWLYLCDRCDNAGVQEINWKLINFITKDDYAEDDMLAFGDRVAKMANGKWRLVKFIKFQYGNLSNDSLLHKSVKKLNDQHLAEEAMHSIQGSDTHGPCHAQYHKDRNGQVRN